MSNKNRLDTIIDTKNKMERIFEEMGLKKEIVGDSVVYYDQKKCHYYRIDFIGGQINALVIETATTYDEAMKNLFEDDDLYPLSLGEKDLLIKFKEDLEKYYLNE